MSSVFTDRDIGSSASLVVCHREAAAGSAAGLVRLCQRATDPRRCSEPRTAANRRGRLYRPSVLWQYRDSRREPRQDIDESMPRRSYEAIRKQIEKLEAQARKLEEAAAEKKKQAVAQVVALMKKLGVGTDDLGPTRTRRRRAVKGSAKAAPKKRAAKKPVAPKFRNGKTGETWSGRGRTPRWLAALEAQGRSREDYRV